MTIGHDRNSPPARQARTERRILESSEQALSLTIRGKRQWIWHNAQRGPSANWLSARSCWPTQTAPLAASGVTLTPAGEPSAGLPGSPEIWRRNSRTTRRQRSLRAPCGQVSQPSLFAHVTSRVERHFECLLFTHQALRAVTPLFF